MTVNDYDPNLEELRGIEATVAQAMRRIQRLLAKYGVKAGLDLTSSDGTMTPVDTPTRAARVAELMAQAAKRAQGVDDADGLV